MTDAYRPPASTDDLQPTADRQPPVGLEVRIVAAFLAAGGLWGILSVLWQSASLGSSTGLHLTARVPLLGLLPFGLTLTAGVLLWSGRRAAVLFAITLLVAQTLAIRVPGFDYHFHTGFAALVGVVDWNLQVTGSLGFSFGFWVGGPGRPEFVLLNLAAVTGLLCLAPSLIDEPKTPK